MKRRHFFAAGSVLLTLPVLATAADQRRRVAVIGHTGRGDYGHGLDTVWQSIPATEIVAVADADEAGLAKAVPRLNQAKGWSDYRLMLAEVRPEFVAVCSRHADQHRDMILAAIEFGARGIYIEKPFVRTPEEADQVAAACRKSGTKIAVGHRNRYHPVIAIVQQMIADGTLGRVHELRGRGKGDRRGGGEDLWVLGSHVLNLIHLFGGEPQSCSALMLQGGRRVTREDVKPGAEGLGPLAANELHVRYHMSNGIMATFDSIANDDFNSAGFGLQIIGTKGIVNIQVDRDPVAHFIPGNPFAPTSTARPWIPITTAGVGKPESQPDLIASVASHVLAVQDLIAAVDGDHEPLCGLHAGTVIVEMITAVFESHRQDGRAIRFPLEERSNALTKLQ